MLTSFLFFLVYVWLTIIHGVLSAIPIGVPAQVSAAVVYFGGYLHYMDGYIDIVGVFAALSFLLNFLMGWFAFKVVLWTYHLIAARSVHQNQALPAQTKS